MDIPDCMIGEEIRITMLDVEYIGMQSELIHCGWPSIKAQVPKDLQPYWSLRDEITIKDDIAVKGRRRIIPAVLQDKL